MAPERRFNVQALTAWARSALEVSGVETDKAAAIAEVLIEADLLGHDTHGLALIGAYLRMIRQGEMMAAGGVEVLSDRPAATLWDGRMLPGPWLVCEAISEGVARALEMGTATVVVRRSGHIACLEAYLEAPARAGMVVEIFSSDPSTASVAPFGGCEPVFTPNPIAIGIPTSGDPVMVDVSTSITTNGLSARVQAAGGRFPGDWFLDSSGRPTNDPAVLTGKPPGTIQLLGGTDGGHKGYGMTIGVEAMTGGLAGYGRAEKVSLWGANFMVRITDPEAFGSRIAFERQLNFIADACLNATPADPSKPVRLPGQRGLERKRYAMARGVTLHHDAHTQIEMLAAATGIPLP